MTIKTNHLPPFPLSFPPRLPSEQRKAKDLPFIQGYEVRRCGVWSTTFRVCAPLPHHKESQGINLLMWWVPFPINSVSIKWALSFQILIDHSLFYYRQSFAIFSLGWKIAQNKISEFIHFFSSVNIVNIELNHYIFF